MNPNIFTSKNAPPSPFNIDSVTIQRRTPVVNGNPPFTMTTVWSGTADLQEGGGATFITPAGAVEEIDARLFIDTAAAATLPTVEVNDIVTNANDSKTFTVVSVALQTFQGSYLEIMLKRGPLKYQSR